MRNAMWVGGGITGMGGIPMLGTGARGLTTLIKGIFRNNEQGFAYDPNNLNTLFRDTAGTIPVTAVGQPVGLMLDKSKGLVRGVERVDAQDLSKWASGGAYGNWPQSTATSDTVTNASSSVYGTRSRRFAIKGGQAFEASALVKCLTADMVSIDLVFGTASNTPITERSVSSMSKEFSKVSLRTVAPDNAASCEIVIKVHGATGVTVQVKDITVKQVLGNHATQVTSAARPILRDFPRRIDFDAVDDKLITSLSAQLTGCTVIRSVPNVGTQILMNQTIPTPYNDNTDHCGLIVINRALTASETIQITKLFNKAAGV